MILTKWAVVLLIPAAIFLTPVPAGVTIQGWRLLAVFVGTILGLMFQPLPLGAMALLGVAASALTGALTAGQALAGYAEPLVWMVVAAFCIARGMIKTGLGRRIALLFIRGDRRTRRSASATRWSASDMVLGTGRAVQRRPRRRRHLSDRQEPRRGVRLDAGTDRDPARGVPDADGVSLRHDRVGDVLHRERRQSADRRRWRSRRPASRSATAQWALGAIVAGAGVDGRDPDAAVPRSAAVDHAHARRRGVCRRRSSRGSVRWRAPRRSCSPCLRSPPRCTSRGPGTASTMR